MLQSSVNFSRMENTEYLQRFLEALEHVPPHLSQEFRIMRNLDQKVQDILRTIHTKTNEFVAECNALSREEKMDKIQEIRTLFAKSKELSEDKVSRAENAYEMVDKQIQRLDADLYEFKKSLSVEDRQKMADNHLMRRQSGVRRKRKASKPLSDLMESNENLPATAALALALTNNPAQVIDMPVDPNEPTYCICNQVSFGEMVACDNRECAMEWFHFSCVGLTSNPKGKWYCPNCEPLMARRRASNSSDKLDADFCM